MRVFLGSRRLLGSAAALSLLLCGLGSAAGATDKGSLPISGKSVPRFAPVYMGWVSPHRVSSAEAVSVAKAFDVIAASGTLAPYTGAMHAANRNLVIIDYVNALYSRPHESHPESWYSHDSRGRRITTHQFGNYLMDPTNADWRRSVNASCANDMAKSHFDGCFLDNLGQGPFSSSYVTAPPFNPRTHAIWKESDWMAATSSLAHGVQVAVPPAVIVGNGLVNGEHFFGADGTRPLVTSIDGAMSELWLRAPAAPANGYKSVADWKSDVDMLASAEASGDHVLVTVKLWIHATATVTAAWHKYALASFLLGSSGKSFFNFSAAQTFAGLSADSSWDRVNIGSPAGNYTKVGTAYRRIFAKGVAVVNPNNGATRVPLPAGTYRDLAGHTVRGTVSLGNQEGNVLTKVG